MAELKKCTPTVSPEKVADEDKKNRYDLSTVHEVMSERSQAAQSSPGSTQTTKVSLGGWKRRSQKCSQFNPAADSSMHESD